MGTAWQFAFLLVAAICFGIVAVFQRSLLAVGLFAWVLIPLVNTFLAV